VELLEDESGHRITNFSRAGTAFLYSYEKFLENNQNFDFNIVVVTSPSRTYVKALDGMLVFGEEYLDEMVNKLKREPWYLSRDRHLRIIESVRVYLKDWVDWDMRVHTQHLLVNNLWRINPNTLVIPAFEDSIEQTKKNLNDMAFKELHLIDPKNCEVLPLGKTWDAGRKTVICRRKCHFSKENFRMLYQLIDTAIKNKQKIVEPEIDLLIKPAIEDYFYYTKILTVY
jgi:hypothetical protein